MNSTEFRTYTNRAFRDLALKYELHALEAPAEARDFTAHFHNTTTKVAVVGTAYGFGVNVRLASRRRRHMKFPTYDLDDLLSIRDAEFKVPRASDHDTNDIQKQQIDAYAGALDKHASDVLSGDFAVFPRLAEAIQTRIENQKRESEALRAQSVAMRNGPRSWWKWW
jgi:hypothetical protein